MTWHPDIPDLPIVKPKIIEDLEQMDRHVLDAMPPTEVTDTIDSVAYAVARAYEEQCPHGDYDGCLEFTSIALEVTGASIGGKFGSSMVAAGNHAAKTATLIFFPQNE